MSAVPRRHPCQGVSWVLLQDLPSHLYISLLFAPNFFWRCCLFWFSQQKMCRETCTFYPTSRPRYVCTYVLTMLSRKDKKSRQQQQKKIRYNKIVV
jgi:hypothetical protein